MWKCTHTQKSIELTAQYLYIRWDNGSRTHKYSKYIFVHCNRIYQSVIYDKANHSIHIQLRRCDLQRENRLVKWNIGIINNPNDIVRNPEKYQRPPEIS